MFVLYGLSMRLKLQATGPKHAAFTLLEVLVVLLIVFVLTGLLLPALSGPTCRGSLQTKCMNNQKQLVLAAMMYSFDHNDRLPWSPFDSELGASFSGTAPDVFAQLKPYVAPRTDIFVCSTDTKRSPTTKTLQSTNLSYFLNLSSQMNTTNQVLLGDRHLALNGVAVGPGQVAVRAGASLDWTRELHPRKDKNTQGIMAFTDGHAEVVRGGATVPAAFDRSATREQTLLIP